MFVALGAPRFSNFNESRGQLQIGSINTKDYDDLERNVLTSLEQLNKPIQKIDEYLSDYHLAINLIYVNVSSLRWCVRVRL